MSFFDTYDNLDEEVKELLQHYKHKKATGYEPCTLENFKLQLLRLSEEFDLLNINYIFNPYLDIKDNTLEPVALVNLINSVWTLLHYYKNVNEKADRLVELEQNNKQLNAHIKRLKEKISLEKNEAKACVASAQKIADRSDTMLQTLTETRAKLLKVTKQKAASEKNLQNEIARLKLQIEKLSDRLRNKDVSKPCSDFCDTTLMRLKEREKQQRATIAHLQKVNQDLLHQILDLKEDLLLSGLNEVNINK
ncbi:uncharacterized protein LOC115445103 isoform X2 [Manduca sexta]|uniref:Uncharacterized protein n=2 Tax=Manduca sexta TaxID=7130 RepID=A0A921Z7Z9_MANSE|nr:uncharacterized protein LOC115445103 isoform X2 [Manduca sexta]KAG6452560.1 hypothetical protein O3G_MSEX007720 [Manduca sexta]